MKNSIATDFTGIKMPKCYNCGNPSAETSGMELEHNGTGKTIHACWECIYRNSNAAQVTQDMSENG